MDDISFKFNMAGFSHTQLEEYLLRAMGETDRVIREINRIAA